MNNIFDQINNAIRNTESSLVNLLSAIAPWFAPLSPAFMSFYHMTTLLSFPWWIAGPVAAAVEILGFSTIVTAVDFWTHNKRYTKDYKRAPVWIAVLAFVWYLIIVLCVNVVLEIGRISTAEIIARALLTLLSVPAALILAVRTEHTALLAELSSARKNAKLKDLSGFDPDMQKLLQRINNLPESVESTTKVADWRNLRVQDRRKVAVMEIPAIMNEFGVSERTAFNWKKWGRDNGNGHGG